MRIIKRKVNRAVKKLVIAISLEIRGEVVELIADKIIFTKNIRDVITEGIKIPKVELNLSSPQGIWLKTGISGGSLFMLIKIYPYVTTIRINVAI